MAYFKQSRWQNQRKLVTQRIEPKLRPRRSTAVELLTVIDYTFYIPNASRDPLRNIRVFYCGKGETLYNLKGRMDKILKTKSGYTLVEVLVSVGIMLIFVPFAGNMLANSKLLASYSKHKIQAAYAAEQIIETYQQSAFIVLSAGQSQTIPAAGANAVILDTKGNYASSVCGNGNTGNFCGTAVITVTPSVYTSTTGVKTTSTSVDHFVVTISWIEQILKLQVPMTLNYAEDIANDTMLN